jgi:hypothetical protein
MVQKSATLLTCTVFSFLIVLQPAVAEEKRQRELPKSGTLAGSLVSGYDSKAVDMPWGEEVGDKEAPPISGSVSRVGPNQWVARIFNNTPDRYSVDLEVVQIGESGARVRSDYFSYTLKPGETAERPVRTGANVAQCTLNLRNWKNLSEITRERAAAAEKKEAAAKK